MVLLDHQLQIQPVQMVVLRDLLQLQEQGVGMIGMLVVEQVSGEMDQLHLQAHMLPV